MSTFLDGLFGIRGIFLRGVEQITRKAIDFVGNGWTLTDNATTGRTEISFTPTAPTKGQVTINHGTIGAQSSVGSTGSLSGAAIGDSLSLSPTTDLPNGFAIAESRVPSADTVLIQLLNATGSPLSAGSITYDVTAHKGA